MHERLLPAEFAALEPFMEWAIPSMEGRIEKRRTASFANAQAFYDVIFPRIAGILDYLDRFDLNDMPDDARRLSWLALSLVEISPAIEMFGQMRVPNAERQHHLPMHHAVSGEW
jgi:hypothetical protein